MEIKKFKVAVIGVSKAGKSTFITACFHDSYEVFKEIIAQNKGGQTKVRIVYQLDGRQTEGSVTFSKIELKSYDSIVDIIKKWVSKKDSSRGVEDIDLNEIVLSEYMDKNVADTLSMIQLLTEEGVLIDIEQYNQLNSSDLINSILQKDSNITEVYKKLNDADIAMLIEEVIFTLKPSQVLEGLMEAKKLDVLELMDTRGITDINGDCYEQLAKVARFTNETNSEQQDEEHEVSKASLLEAQFGLDTVDMCICFSSDEVSGDSKKFLDELLDDLVKRIPVMLIEKSQILDFYAETQNSNFENKNEYLELSESKLVCQRHFRLYNVENILKRMPKSELIQEIVKENASQKLLPEIVVTKPDSETPIGEQRYDNAHKYILGDILSSLEALYNLRKSGEQVLKDNWAEFEHRMNACILKTSNEFEFYYIYPNLRRNGFNHEIDWALKTVLEGYAVCGPRGGITPWNHYYFITATSICSYAFINKVLENWAELNDDLSINTLSKHNLRSIKTFIQKQLSESGDIKRKYAQVDHYTYPLSVERLKVKQIVKENNLSSSREYYIKLMQTFINDIKKQVL